MIYGSVCSGIEAATMAWEPLGWKPAFFSEIEAFPRAVLAHRYATVPCHGDFTTIGADEYGPIDLLVGGTPCQSFSVAGLRGGLADERGNLALEYLRLADRTRARWLVWENVPGVLSSNGGRDFGTFLGGLAELGYGFAYRVLDAQFFGVPQRRRRVFVVGYLGDWRHAAAVLFERHSLSGNPPPRREKEQGAAGRLARSVAIRGRAGTPQAELGDEVANAILTPNGGRAGVGVGAALIGGWDYENNAHGADEPTGPLLKGSPTGGGRPLPAIAVETFDRQSSGEYGTEPVASTVSARDYKSPSDLIAFTAKDHGADAQNNLSPTLRAGGHSGSHANAGVMPAVAIPYDFFNITAPVNRQNRKDGDPCHTLARDNAAYATILTNGAPNGQLDDGSLSCAQDMSAWALRALREAAERGSPQERRLAGQPARELDAALSQLSHQGASPEEALHHLRATSEGARLLQQASAALQAMGRSDAGQNQSEHASSAVRRLTPRECERLQGFPDDYTLVPYRGKPAADGPRYKALGNSMAVPVMRWIGERIARVEALQTRAEAA